MPRKKYPRKKEVERLDATIKISTLMDVIEDPKDSFTNKEKRRCVEIKLPWGVRTSTSFCTGKKGTKELLKFIKDVLNI